MGHVGTIGRRAKQVELKDLRREVAGFAKIMKTYDIAEMELKTEGLTMKLRKETNTSPPCKIGVEAEAISEDSRLNHSAYGWHFTGRLRLTKNPISAGDTMHWSDCMYYRGNEDYERDPIRGKRKGWEILIENAEPVVYGQPHLRDVVGMCPTKCRRYIVSDLSIRKVVVANRGEIALRIIRAAKELGIKSVALYSEPDKDSLPVIMADEAYCIGPGPSIESYLNIANIISAAQVSGADAIHPGYGFLAENPHFAEICSSHGIKFIGPGYDVMSSMGNKAIAKQLMAEHGLKVIPHPGIIHDVQEAEGLFRHGFPVRSKQLQAGGKRNAYSL